MLDSPYDTLTLERERERNLLLDEMQKYHDEFVAKIKAITNSDYSNLMAWSIAEGYVNACKDDVVLELCDKLNVTAEHIYAFIGDEEEFERLMFPERD